MRTQTRLLKLLLILRAHLASRRIEFLPSPVPPALCAAWRSPPPHTQGFPSKALTKLEDYGFIQSRAKGEYHANNQTMAKLLHKAIGLGTGSAADASAYDAYMAHFESAPPHVLRDCLMLETGGGFIWGVLGDVLVVAGCRSGFCGALSVLPAPVCLQDLVYIHQGLHSQGQNAAACLASFSANFNPDTLLAD